MAFPIIKIDSTDGASSDTACSGAGPSTALTGTAASTSGDGLTVTLDGTPDLSGVATDGSHVVFLNDATAGGRNFGKITAVDDGADTVTVSDAFGLTLTDLSWAIGGVRASLGQTNSLKLIINNSASGDLMPSWTAEFQSGHTETTPTAGFGTINRDGDEGPITVRGESGAATPPVITLDATSTVHSIFLIRGIGWVIRDIDLECTGSANGIAISGASSSGGRIVLDGIRIKHATNVFNLGLKPTHSGSIGWLISNCEIANCDSHGIQGELGNCQIHGCHIHDNTGAGIAASTSLTPNAHKITDNIIADNGADGISINGRYAHTISGNVIDGNTGDGLQMSQILANDLQGISITNNQITNNSGYGVNWDGSGITQARIDAGAILIESNNTFSNTSGHSNLSASMDSGNPKADPGYTDAAGGDYSVDATMANEGSPDYTLPGSATRSYVDIGPQRVAAGGGGGTSMIGPGGGMIGRGY